jgi:P4 family phage/plasmid primase-like protien
MTNQILFFQTQIEAFKYADENSYDLIICCKNGNGFKFSAIPHTMYKKLCLSLKKSNDIENINTMIREGQRDKMRLDIEIYLTDSKNIKKAEKIINNLINDLNDYTNKELEYIESDNSREYNKEQFTYKYSKHLIFNCYFETITHQKIFWTNFLNEYDEYKKIANNKLHFNFDMSVYNKNSQWNESKRSSDSSLYDRCPTIIDTDEFELIEVELNNIKEVPIKQLQIEETMDEDEEKEEEEDNKKTVRNTIKPSKAEKLEIMELSKLFSMDRLDNYNSWKDLIFCLSCISYTPQMEKIAIEISKLSPKSKSPTFKQDFNKLWNNADGKSFSMGSLYYWAKTDSPDEYKKYLNKKIYEQKGECLLLDDNEILLKDVMSSDMTDKGISKIIKKLLNNRVFKISSSILYMVNINNIWTQKSISNLIKIISNDIVYTLTKLYYNNIGDNLENEDVFRIFHIISRLKESTEIKKILYYLEPEITNEKFPEKLDLNPDLFAFNNKVVNLKTKEIRNIQKNDYISITTGYNYPTEEIKYRNEINNFFEKIHSNTEQRDFVFQQFSQYLSGRTGNHTVLTHAGKDNSGGNGKSILFNLNHKAFGNYAYCMPSDILYSKVSYNPQSPRPDIIHLKGKRLVYCNEPDAKQELNLSWIKGATGGDRMSARYCNANEIIEFIPQLHLNILCNKKLQCDAFDGGFQRRNKVIEYGSKFVESKNDVDEENNIYLSDSQFEDNILLWRNDYIRILIEKYNFNYKFECPEIVKINSQKYLDSNNQVLLFKDKYLTESNGFITITEIKNVWRKDQDYDKMKISDLIAGFKTVFGKNYYEKKRVDGKEIRSVIMNYSFIENEDV